MEQCPEQTKSMEDKAQQFLNDIPLHDLDKYAELIGPAHLKMMSHRNAFLSCRQMGALADKMDKATTSMRSANGKKSSANTEDDEEIPEDREQLLYDFCINAVRLSVEVATVDAKQRRPLVTAYNGKMMSALDDMNEVLKPLKKELRQLLENRPSKVKSLTESELEKLDAAGSSDRRIEAMKVLVFRLKDVVTSAPQSKNRDAMDAIKSLPLFKDVVLRLIEHFSPGHDCRLLYELTRSFHPQIYSWEFPVVESSEASSHRQQPTRREINSPDEMRTVVLCLGSMMSAFLRSKAHKEASSQGDGEGSCPLHGEEPCLILDALILVNILERLAKDPSRWRQIQALSFATHGSWPRRTSAGGNPWNPDRTPTTSFQTARTEKDRIEEID